ncbi:hypothetical protein EDB81DRAFT_769599 [Dactylonectria macrodidyma]|uniref:Uncharacterized protein n=1 Tax=Dactylonectria macrodidyma TaxID=307937 RepID=A0A9P9JMM4_9HYPO|nr:hypothetical protein EDB81DRAFT_769599 [Dactylonectria macrodidyma]
MLRSLARFYYSDDAKMSTRESSGHRSTHNQSRQSHARTSDLQQMPELPTGFEEECNRLAQEIANIPAVMRDHLARAEGDSGTRRDSHNRNRNLNVQLQRLTRELQLKDSEIHNLESELEASKVKIQNLRVKEQTLRDFVLESDPYQAISDGDVINAFTRIRQGIQKLASSKSLQLDRPLLDLKSSIFVEEEDLATLWPGSHRPGRVLILRALLFRTVSRQILTQDVFGISDSEEDQAEDRHSWSGLNSGLSQFERALVHCNVPNDVVVNWRLSTLKSVEAAGMSKGASGTALAEQLYGFFATFMVEGATQQEQAKLQRGFSELCSQAYALRLLMRKSRESYQCLPISSGTLLEEVEHLADVYGETDGKKDGKVRITFTLCDGLVKPRSQTEQPLVLEKAQVITTRG